MTRDGKEDSMSHVDEGTLHAYLDGELPSAERAALEAHLAACATCRASLAEERALLERASALLGSARPVERPAPPFDQLRRASQRSPWRVRRSFAWAASLALALGLGYYIRNPTAHEAFQAPPQAAFLAEDRAAAPAEPEKAVARRQPGAAGRRSIPPAPPATAAADELASAERQREADSVGRAPASRSVLDTVPRRQEPAHLDAVVVTGRAAENAALAAPAPQSRLAATEWPIISRSAARSLLGTDPVGLPGLPTRRIRRSPGTDATVIVEQAVDSSTVIQIIQRPASTNALYDSAARGYSFNRSVERQRADRLARFVGRLRVEITGPVSVDSLNRLLEQVAPLP
jgi:hypothetical protein